MAIALFPCRPSSPTLGGRKERTVQGAYQREKWERKASIQVGCPETGVVPNHCCIHLEWFYSGFQIFMPEAIKTLKVGSTVGRASYYIVMSSPSELLDKLGEVFVAGEKPNYLNDDTEYVEQYEIFSKKVFTTFG